MNNEFLLELNSMKTIDFWEQFLQNTTKETTDDDNNKMSSIGVKPSFSSSSFFDVSNHPTIQDQVVLCRQIARQLVCDETNAKSKGREMFEKRMQKSSKWVTTDDNDDDDQESHHETTISTGPVNLKLLGDPRHVQDLKSLDFESNEVEMERNRARGQSLSKEILFDLNSPEINPSKGNTLFAERVSKSQEWIVDQYLQPIVTLEDPKQEEKHSLNVFKLEHSSGLEQKKFRDFNARARPFNRSY